MDWVESKGGLVSLLHKYKWAAAVFVAGLVLMALPGSGGQKADPVQQQEASGPEMTLQQELEQLLSRLEGAGKVQVLLSIGTGSQTHYQTDGDRSETENTREERRQTVILTGPDRGQSGLVTRQDPPVYLGAVVLCQGADSPRVKLAVVDAVATATGLTSDRISVWKMN